MSFKGWEAKQMKDPKFRAAWDKLQPEYWAARKQQMLAIPEVRALVEAARLAHHTEWTWKIFGILQDRNRELAEKFQVFMRDLHAAFAPFEEDR